MLHYYRNYKNEDNAYKYRQNYFSQIPVLAVGGLTVKNIIAAETLNRLYDALVATVFP